MTPPTHGTCDGCARLRRLTPAGMVVTHFIAIPVSRSAVRSVGAGRVRRRCPGAGRPPRKVER